MRVEEEARDVFEKISFATHMTKDDILYVARSIHEEDLNNRHAVQQLIERLCRLTNRSISSEQESLLIDAILDGKIPQDLQSLQYRMNDD